MSRPVIFMGILFVLLLNGCEGVQDLIIDQRPQLGELQLSANQVMPLDTVRARISATNPIEGSMEYEWSVLPDRGYLLQPADADTAFWVAPLQGGVYQISVRVSNSKRSVNSAPKDVNVLISSDPVVNIRKPLTDAYFVLGQTFTIEARARHDNGLSWVRAFVNDSLVGQSDQTANSTYLFQCTAAANMVGAPYIKIRAAAANALAPVGSDSVRIKIGGIIPGKRGF